MNSIENLDLNGTDIYQLSQYRLTDKPQKSLNLGKTEVIDLTPLSRSKEPKFTFPFKYQQTSSIFLPFLNLFNLNHLIYSRREIFDLTHLSSLIMLKNLNLANDEVSDLETCTFES